MASDDEKIKTNSAPENEVPPEKKSTSGAEASKADGGESVAASPPGYSRGEGQKPVSKAYRDNWNVIFAKKKKRQFARSAERNSTAWRTLPKNVELMSQYQDFGLQPLSRLEAVAQYPDEQEADYNHAAIMF